MDEFKSSLTSPHFPFFFYLTLTFSCSLKASADFCSSGRTSRCSLRLDSLDSTPNRRGLHHRRCHLATPVGRVSSRSFDRITSWRAPSTWTWVRGPTPIRRSLRSWHHEAEAILSRTWERFGTLFGSTSTVRKTMKDKMWSQWNGEPLP